MSRVAGSFPSRHVHQRVVFISSKTKTGKSQLRHHCFTRTRIQNIPNYQIQAVWSLTADTNYSTLFTVHKCNQQKLVQVDTASIANLHCIFSLEWVGGILRNVQQFLCHIVTICL